MKLKKIDSIAIWSSEWRKLADWYKKTFGLEENMTLDLPNDTGTNLIIGDGSVLFWIGYHDQVEGKSKEPYRIMVAFEVEDVFEAYEDLKKKDVKFIEKPQAAPTDDFYFATLQDPENNTVNLFSFNKEGHE